MKRLWICFVSVMFVSFLILGWIGTRIYQEAPPIAARVVTTDGTVVIDEGEIAAGQNVWQTMGGMEVGSIWGHGSYVAPDWTADWLHREAIFILDRWANADFGSDYEQLDEERQGQLSGRLSKLMRTNTYDLVTQTISIDRIVGLAVCEHVRVMDKVGHHGRRPPIDPTTTRSNAPNNTLTPNTCPFGSRSLTKGPMNSPAANQAVAIQNSPIWMCHVRVTLYGNHSESGNP